MEHAAAAEVNGFNLFLGPIDIVEVKLERTAYLRDQLVGNLLNPFNRKRVAAKKKAVG